MVDGSLTRKEALPGRCDIAVCKHAIFGIWCEDDATQTNDLLLEMQSYVCLGLAWITPSSLTMPTPTLLAEPSIPSTSMTNCVHRQGALSHRAQSKPKEDGSHEASSLFCNTTLSAMPRV